MTTKMTVNTYLNYDAIIFDMDGTLVDSGRLHQNAWTKTLIQFGIPVEPEMMRSLAGVPPIETIEILATHFSIELTATVETINSYREQTVSNTLTQYVKPTKLSKLAFENKGKRPMAVGTGTYTHESEMILCVCGLRELIDHVVGADQVKRHKPHPDTFLRCAELMEVEPKKCIVFEDSHTGIQAAQSAGMFVVDVFEQFQIQNDYFLTKKDY